MASVIARSALSVFFEYDTPRIVHIRSKKVGVINRLIQLVIIGYIIGFAIVYKKGYQEFGSVQSAVTTKVKGVAMVNDSNVLQKVWDVSDYVVPPQENNAFFVITNLIVTPNQKQGICPEDSNVQGAICKSDADCKEGEHLPSGNGFMTGVCNGTCLIHAWCDVENGSRKAPEVPLLLQSKDFTVFIKNNIEFPKFDVKRQNLPLNAPTDYLQTCKFDASHVDCPIFTLQSIIEGAHENYKDMAKELSQCRYSPHDSVHKFCPIFVLGDVVKLAGQDYTEMASSGGVMQIIINWDCNLDYSVDKCVPEYEFRRLDSKDYKISKGFNFRFAKYYQENGVETRTLYKAFGIKYIVTVTGTAGQFRVVPLILNIASGLALLSVATIICDIVVLYVLKAKHLYKEKKYLQVEGDDAYKVLGSEHERRSSEIND